MRIRLFKIAACGLFGALAFACISAVGQGTAFNYQGQLNAGGGPATGSYDLTFAVFDAAANGNPVGATLTNAATSVSNGLFSVTLDFGAEVFKGGALWMEAGVRTNGGSGPFTVLAPRQPVLSMPYAIQSLNAASAGSAQVAGSANSVAATNISGTVALAQLPGAVLTNGASGINISGAFSGDAHGLTGVPESSLIFSTNTSCFAWGDEENVVNIPSGLTNVVAAAIGGDFALALKSDGTVAAWGDDSSGEIDIPAGLSNVVAVSAGDDYSLALKSDGTVAAWGNVDYDGQGDVPAGLSNVVAIAANGAATSFAIKADGTVAGWGADIFNLVSFSTNLSNIKTIEEGFTHALAIKTDGTIVAWGDNSFGQTNVPAGLSNVVAVAGGREHSMALQANGAIVAWGSGPGTNIPAGLSNVMAITAGYNSGEALKTDGTVVVWGVNFTGETNVPPNLHSVTALASSFALNSIPLVVLGVASSSIVPLLTGDNTFNGNETFSGHLIGDGSGLTNVIAAGFTNAISDAQLSANVALLDGANIFTGTNYFAGAVMMANQDNQFTGTFIGDGSGLINVTAANFTNMISDAQLSANVALLNGAGIFSGTNYFAGPVLATNQDNQFGGLFIGDGSGLMNLDYNAILNPPVLPSTNGFVTADITNGLATTGFVTSQGYITSADGGNAALATNVISGISITNAFITNSVFSGDGAGLTNLPLSGLQFLPLTNNQGGASLTGTFSGNGGALTNLNAANLTNTISDARLSSNVPLLNGANVFGGTNRFAGAVIVSNANNQLAGTFSGDGAGLTNLPLSGLQFLPLTNNQGGASLTGTFSGNGGALTNLNAANLTNTISDARLSSNVPLLNGANVFGGTNRFAGVAIATNMNNEFTGTFSGNGAGLTNVEAAATVNFNGAITLTTNRAGFRLSSTLNVSSGPDSVIAVDINGDGKVDLISANGSANTLTVLTNDGGGGFALSATLNVGHDPVSVIAADVNGDGKMDLVSANEGVNTLTVLTNDGSGGFALSGTLSVGGTVSVIAADVNGDGKVDLISANQFDNTLTVLTNNGSGGFVLSATLNVGQGPIAAAAVDCNGDGKVDLVSANQGDNTLTILTNNGSGNFVFAFAEPLDSAPVSLAVADIAGEGRLDLICGNLDETLVTLVNDGAGFAYYGDPLNAGNLPVSITTADVNGDGEPDIICANIFDHTLSVFVNDGFGDFTLSATLSVGGARSVTAADVNGDGAVDLICANQNDNTLLVLTNTLQVIVNFAGNGAGLTNLNAANLTNTVSDARLSSNVPLLNGADRFSGAVTATNANNQFVGGFTGNGAGLTNLPLSSLQLAPLTNNQTGVSLTGAFSGDGGALANLNGANLTNQINAGGGLRLYGSNIWFVGGNDTYQGLGYYGGNKYFGTYAPNGPILFGYAGGALGATSVSSNLALAWDASQNVTIYGTLSAKGNLNVSNNLTISGTVTGDGSGLVNLNAANLTNTADLAFLNGTNVFTGTNRFAGVAIVTNANNQFTGAFTGDGGALTNLPLSGLRFTPLTNAQAGVSLAGTFTGNGGTLTNLNAANLTNTANLVFLNGANVFTGTNRFTNVAIVTNANNQFTGAFTGNGAALTNLPLSSLQLAPLTNNQTGVSLTGAFSGDGGALTNLNAANLTNTANLAFLNGTNVFSGTNRFTGVAVVTNANSQFAGTFTGNGMGLTNTVTAATNLFAYDTNLQAINSANTFQDINFSTVVESNGWTRVPSGTSFGITANSSFLFFGEYTATVEVTSGAPVTVTIYAFDSNTFQEIPGSEMTTTITANNEPFSVSKSFIFNMFGADNLHIQFASGSTGVELVPAGAGTIKPSVSLTVVRIK